jgi:hypothetical protein
MSFEENFSSEQQSFESNLNLSDSQGMLGIEESETLGTGNSSSTSSDDAATIAQREQVLAENKSTMNDIGDRSVFPVAIVPEPLVGDTDLDLDVDLDDYSLLLEGLNTDAMIEDDPRDLDSDGTITVLDGRKLAIILAENTDKNAPELSSSLLNDTGEDDGITADPSITGTVIDDSNVTSLKVGIDSTNQLTEIIDLVGGDGNFTISTDKLNEINGSPLANGEHTVYLMAKDQWGNETAINQLTFTLETGETNESSFLSDVEFSEEGLFVGETTNVTFSVDVANPAGAEIQLFELDETGNSVLVGELFDDGDLAKGDDIAGDGVFNNKFDLSPTEVSDLSFSATIESTGEETNPTSLEVIEPISDQDFQAILDFNTAINDQLQSLLNSGATVEDAFTQIQATLEVSPLVKTDSIVVLPNSIGWETPQGIGIVLDANQYLNDGQKGGNGNSATAPAEDLTVAANSHTSKETPSLAATPDSEGCNKALVLSPYAWDFEPNDESNEIAQKLRDEGFDVVDKYNTVESDQNITVDDFKNLDEYDAIASGDDVVILTGQEATILNKVSNLFDLLSGRLVLGGGNTYAITPSFITQYTEDMPDSVVYVSSCRSTFTDSLANAFIGEGASAFIGYSDYVDTTFAEPRGQLVFDTLLDGKTTGDIPGINVDVETDSDPASFDLIGLEDATISLTSLKNGIFEDGEFKCWTTEGDARIISALGSLTPPEGDRMAIVSTGLGSVSDSQSSISQKFLVADNAETLELTYNVISEEPLEFVGTQFDDQFQILVDGNVIAQETINSSSWIPVSGIDFAGGDSTVFQTGFKDISVDLSAYKGQSIELEIRTFDLGDSIYDTAALIDDVKVTTT